MINRFSLKLREVICTGLLALCFYSLPAQQYDANWLMGYNGGLGDTTFGITQMHFYKFGKVGLINNQKISMWITGTNASMSDEEGNLLFYTNGQYVEDKSFKLLQNGNDINEIDDDGDNAEQSALFIPYPENADKTIMFNGEITQLPVITTQMVALKYSIIDHNINNGKGGITIKNNYLVKDTLNYGKITATKHANGRDWWLLVAERNKNSFYRYLITPQGIIKKPIQQLPGKVGEAGVGQACFSPDGTKYTTYNIVNNTDGQWFDLYDFDRCNGMLSNHKHLHNYDELLGGVAFSPNSKYLYFTLYNNIYQADLSEPEPLETMQVVASYDGFVDLLPTRFYLSQLAPDGKIYITTVGGSFRMHVIEHPNRKGKSCDVRQHELKLYTYNLDAIPNFPNYRLGPIDGSECDTLGINNLPIANFRADQDTSIPLKFEFNDLSYYEPTDWSWDFGDGSFSSDTSPVHLFPKKGKYIVCLTVSNQYGSNTTCDTLYIGVDPTSTYSLLEVQVSVYPNPASDYINFIMNDYYPSRAIIRLFDQKGVKVKEQVFRQGWNIVEVKDLVGGVYLYEVVDENRVVSSGKVLVVR